MIPLEYTFDAHVERRQLAHQVESRHQKISAFVVGLLAVMALAGVIYCTVLAGQFNSMKFSAAAILLGLTSVCCIAKAIFSAYNGYAQFVPPSTDNWNEYLATMITPQTVGGLSDDTYRALLDQHRQGPLRQHLLADPRRLGHLGLLAIDEIINDPGVGAYIERELTYIDLDQLKRMKPQIQHNLTVLHEYFSRPQGRLAVSQFPDLDGVPIGRFEIVPGEVSADSWPTIIHLINLTFDVVERLEGQREVISTRVITADNRLNLISSRQIFDLIRVPEGMALIERNLPLREAVPPFKIDCEYEGQRGEFTVDPHLWACKSQFFEGMLRSRLRESSSHVVAFQFPPNVFQLVVRFMEGESLPPFNPNTISDLLFIANYLGCDSLAEAVAAQLAQENIDDASIRELFRHCPQIFPMIFRGMSPQRFREVWLYTLIPPAIFSWSSREMLLRRLNALIPFRREHDPVLNSLIERVALTDFPFRDAFFNEIEQLNLIEPSLETLLTLLINLKHIDIFDLRVAVDRGLVLGFNERLSDGFFQGIEVLNLKALYISREEFRALIRRCPNIRSLSLTSASADWLTCLAELPQLLELDLSDCPNLAGDCLVHLESLSNLQTLNLSGCRNLAPESLQHLRHVPQLRELRLAGCHSLRSLEGLRLVPRLEKLDISDTQFPFDSLRHLANVPHLKVLVANACPFVNENSLVHLAGVQQLECLSLNACLINTASMNHLQHLVRLRELSIGSFYVTNLAWLASFPALQVLILEVMNNLSNLDPLREVPHLQKLSLHGCYRLKSDSLTVISNLPNLRVLDIHSCERHFLENEASLRAIRTHRGLQTVRTAGNFASLPNHLKNDERPIRISW